MTPPSQELLATDLRDLGLTSLAGRVLEGRISTAQTLAEVARQRGVRQRLLLRASTPADEERLMAWCEKATAIIDRHRDWQPA